MIVLLCDDEQLLTIMLMHPCQTLREIIHSIKGSIFVRDWVMEFYDPNR